MSLDAAPRPPAGELFQSPDVEQARAFFQSKSRAMTDKLMTVPEAVARFIHEGDYLATGGFGGVRIATSVLHEIVRRRYTHLGLSGHSTTHDFQILSAGECFDRCDAAYIVGLERRGMSPNARRYMESGRVRVTEWSNATLGWRYKAAAMGVPFLPTSCLMGTDTMTRSAAREMACPFTGQRLLAVPALFPDVGVIHVHRADVYGNAQIDGVTIADWDIARACKRLIITAEALVETEEIRRKPATTVVPYWLTDAVCHVPYGSYPGNMPFEYYSDETHLADWMRAEEDPAVFAEFLDTYIYGTRNFNEYLTLNGGEERMAELRALEPLKR
jgi:glutaconate CoA-transferase, subunit A